MAGDWEINPWKSLNGAISRILNGPGIKLRLLEVSATFLVLLFARATAKAILGAKKVEGTSKSHDYEQRDHFESLKWPHCDFQGLFSQPQATLQQSCIGNFMSPVLLFFEVFFWFLLIYDPPPLPPHIWILGYCISGYSMWEDRLGGRGCTCIKPHLGGGEGTLFGGWGGKGGKYNALPGHCTFPMPCWDKPTEELWNKPCFVKCVMSSTVA